LILRYKDQYHGAICYLDFWAMLFVEFQIAIVYPAFADLPRLASKQKRGLDIDVLRALQEYVNSARVRVVDNEHAERWNKKYGLLAYKGELYLKQQAANDGPGALTVTRPPIIPMEKDLSLIPQLLQEPSTTGKLRRDDRAKTPTHSKDKPHYAISTMSKSQSQPGLRTTPGTQDSFTMSRTFGSTTKSGKHTRTKLYQKDMADWTLGGIPGNAAGIEGKQKTSQIESD